MCLPKCTASAIWACMTVDAQRRVKSDRGRATGKGSSPTWLCRSSSESSSASPPATLWSASASGSLTTPPTWLRCTAVSVPLCGRGPGAAAHPKATGCRARPESKETGGGLIRPGDLIDDALTHGDDYVAIGTSGRGVNSYFLRVAPSWARSRCSSKRVGAAYTWTRKGGLRDRRPVSGRPRSASTNL